ncbi:MAG: hypothetical protein ACLSG8_04525 [Barnesiella sp.]
MSEGGMTPEDQAPVSMYRPKNIRSIPNTHTHTTTTIYLIFPPLAGRRNADEVSGLTTHPIQASGTITLFHIMYFPQKKYSPVQCQSDIISYIPKENIYPLFIKNQNNTIVFL